MRFFQKLSLLTGLLLIGLVGFASAQPNQCDAVVQDAVNQILNVCDDLGRNQACYGNTSVEAIPQPTVDDLMFDAPGDTAAVTDIASLSLSEFNTDEAAWGVALLKVQANLPDALPGQNVTMVLFGDVALEPDTEVLNAFYFQGAPGQPTCNEAPNGMLIQTPEGAGEVQLTLNNVQIALGSTLFVSLETLEETEGTLQLDLLEGTATVTADDESVDITAGETVRVPVAADLLASGAPETADTDTEALPALPYSLLERDITTADAESTAEPDTTAGGEIVPLSGSWQFAFGEFVFGDGCPAMLNETQIREQIGQFGVSADQVNELNFESGTVRETLFDPGQPIDGLTYGQPAPNTYTVTIAAEGFSVVYTYNIVSETLIEGTIDQDLNMGPLGDCSIDIGFTITHQG